MFGRFTRSFGVKFLDGPLDGELDAEILGSITRRRNRSTEYLLFQKKVRPCNCRSGKNGI
jgi:hypothetical protein